MEQPSHDLPALVRRCIVRLEQGSGHGTGFFVAPGLILTCAHVVETAQTTGAPVGLYWQNQKYQAQIIAYLARPYPDLALLRLDQQTHPCVYLQTDMALGDTLYSYGYTDEQPAGDSAMFEYEGPTNEAQPLLKLKAGQARPGLSGAPLLNQRTGGVCGVVKSSRDRGSDLGGRAIPTTLLFTQFGELMTAQERFHQHDRSWITCLTFSQRQDVPWRTPARANPFLGDSPQLLGRDEEMRRIEEKLRVGNHCSIVGPSGSGKSHLLRTLGPSISSWLGCQPQQVLLLHCRGVTSRNELQAMIVQHLGGQRANEWRSLLHHKPLRLLILDDLGSIDPGARGLGMRSWLRSLDDLYGTKLLMVSNERLDILFRRDDPTRDSPLAGLDPLPVELAPLSSEICARIVQQRLAETSLCVTQFTDLFDTTPRQPKQLLTLCAVRYEDVRRDRL